MVTVSEVKFDDEYRYFEMLGPRSQEALRRCRGKWSAVDALTYMRKRGWDPEDDRGDKRLSDEIVRRDRMAMGGLNG
jgi:hypothetical protein